MTRQSYVSNVIRKWNDADLNQKSRGRNWYHNAHQLAEMISGGDARAGAGVLAALSANKRWADNTKLAALAFADGKPSGHVGDALRKVERIMSGEDPEDVLPMGSKTWNFFRCILNPLDPEPICIDRHAHDIAIGVRYGQRYRGLSAVGRYVLLSGIYREAAMRLEEIPQVVQAVCWVAQVEGFSY